MLHKYCRVLYWEEELIVWPVNPNVWLFANRFCSLEKSLSPASRCCSVLMDLKGQRSLEFGKERSNRCLTCPFLAPTCSARRVHKCCREYMPWTCSQAEHFREGKVMLNNHCCIQQLQHSQQGITETEKLVTSVWKHPWIILWVYLKKLKTLCWEWMVVQCGGWNWCSLGYMWW